MGNSQQKVPRLEDLGLHLENGILRTADGSKFCPKDSAERDSVFAAFIPHVQQEIIDLCNLNRIHLPPSGWFAQPQTEIWASSGWESSSVLLVVLTGIGLKIGFWGHDLCLEQGMEYGSQLPHIRRAINEEGWAVLVLNPNQNITEQRETIDGHESCENHVITVWKEIISTSSAGKILLVTHSYGGVCLMRLLETCPDVTKRLYGIAMNDCGGRIDENHPNHKSLTEYLRHRAKNWITSDLPLNSPITSGGAVMMMPSYIPLASAGARRHSETNINTINHTFEFLKSKLDEELPS